MISPVGRIMIALLASNAVVPILGAVPGALVFIGREAGNLWKASPSPDTGPSTVPREEKPALRKSAPFSGRGPRLYSDIAEPPTCSQHGPPPPAVDEPD